MTKLPMIRAGLPAKVEKAKAPVKKDFDQAVAVLRKASGRPEYRLVPLRCAVHDRPFVVIYRRNDPAAQFRIEKISKEAPSQVGAQAASGGMIASFLSGQSDGLAAYDNTEFNSAGRYCPWCNDRETTVHCEDCGDTYCGGSIRKGSEGQRVYHCVPRCGSQGLLHDYHKMHGKRGAPKLQGKGQSLLSKGKPKTALPPPKRLLLPGR